MNKKLLLVGALGLMSASAMAQDIKVYDNGSKLDAQLTSLVNGKPCRIASANGMETVTTATMMNLEVIASDANVVADLVKGAGYEAEAVTDEFAIVNVPSSFVSTLAGCEAVRYVSVARQFRPLMNKIRPETGVDKVIAGEGLETPFTGEGVLIGVIDQGFEYKHPAFLNRVKKYGIIASSGTFSDKAPNRDRLDQNGHATHVANIAGGSKVNDNPYYGIATGASFILVSSDFRSNSVISQTKAIKKYAEENNMPWVINMSFGGVIGPHDGSTAYDQTMSKLTGEGGLLIAAMGNEGGSQMHAHRVIEDATKPVYLYMKSETNVAAYRSVMSEIWGEATDGKETLQVRPLVLYNSRRYELTEGDLAKAGCSFISEINALNKRQRFFFSGNVPQLLTVLGIPSTAQNAYMLWEVKGPKDAGFHAWIDGTSYPSSFGVMASAGVKTKQGDDNYMVGEGAASIGKAIAVASYNNATSYTSQYGQNVSVNYVGINGGISNFSSRGPQIVDLPKPAIAAPGGVVLSAFSKNAKDFEATSQDVVAKENSNGSLFYYGMMSGTSMATPAVTGIVALWLQANPKLTYENLIEIFKKTGRRSSYTGAADETGWNNQAGYGKIDAYEGLKEALRLANQGGINETLNTEAPITLYKGLDAWRVLFNNDESFANINLYSLNGQLVKSQHVDAPRRGQECVVSFEGLQPGVYLIKVGTTASSMTRKVVVK